MVGFTAAIAIVGCTSYKLDVGTLCDAPRYSNLAGEKDPKTKLRVQFEWARRNLHSSEGVALLAKVEGCALGGVSGEPSCKVWSTAAKELRDESVKAGRKECALADWMEQTQQALIDRQGRLR